MSNFIQITEAEWNIIEKHLNGKLSDEEQKIFDNTKSIDGNWEEKIKQVRLTIIGVAEVELEKKLDVFHQSLESGTTLKVVQGQRWKRWLVAASVVVCITMLGLWFSGKPSNEKLFNAYYKADPGLPVVMGAPDHNYTLYDGMISYKEGDYIKAIEKWNKTAMVTGYTDTLNYYLGLAYLSNNVYREARQYLNKVQLLKGSAYQQKAAWYLALIYIREGDIDQAGQLLGRLSDDPRAKELYDKLD